MFYSQIWSCIPGWFFIAFFFYFEQE